MRLKAKGINFSYNCGKRILENLDFVIESGEVVGIFAPSGFGKTTLTKILAGYLTPENGRVILETDEGTEVDLAQHMGYNPVQLIFQHPEQAINPKWKMKKVLAETGIPPNELMEAMGINSAWLNRWPSELSGGEMQRFCVLRALNPNTKFLIADEMTTMLDAITQVQIWQVVLDYAKKNQIGVIVISHEMPLLERICDRIEKLQ